MSPPSPSRPRAPGLGCMRLSTSPDRDEARAVEVIHAALDAGVTVLDTAHAYGLGEAELGHNERLVARALESWSGDRSSVRVLTKGGMARPLGRWEPDGRAGALLAGCEASARALGRDALDAFLLHAPDPRTPLATSVRALARLRREGLVQAVGLCNVKVHQIREALDLTPVDLVQVSLSPFDDEALRNGVLELCRERGITLLAHTPLGGSKGAPRPAKDETLRRLGEKHGATAAEIALAWLLDLGSFVLPLPGATRVASARSLARAARLVLDEEDRAHLAERLEGSLGRRFQGAARLPTSDAAPAIGPVPHPPGEVVLVMGMPAAGKSTLALSLVAGGYRRLNRDERGGRLRDLLPELAGGLPQGSPGFVLDNTYGSRAERQRVLAAARELGLAVRCLWLDTPLEEAQVNAVLRILERTGRLLGPEEIVAEARKDPGILGPGTLFRFRRSFEPPAPEEGFQELQVLPFERRWEGERRGRALVVEYDGVLRHSRAGERAPTRPEDVEVVEGAGQALARYRERGYRLLGTAWHPEVAAGGMTDEDVVAVLESTHRLLGIALEWAVCTHPPGPPTCWCRKPLPGLLVAFLERHRLDPARCLLVGPGSADRTLAARVGVPFLEMEAFLGGDTPPADLGASAGGAG